MGSRERREVSAEVMARIDAVLSGHENQHSPEADRLHAEYGFPRVHDGPLQFIPPGVTAGADFGRPGCAWCGCVGYHSEWCEGFEVNDPARVPLRYRSVGLRRLADGTWEVVEREPTEPVPVVGTVRGMSVDESGSVEITGEWTRAESGETHDVRPYGRFESGESWPTLSFGIRRDPDTGVRNNFAMFAEQFEGLSLGLPADFMRSAILNAAQVDAAAARIRQTVEARGDEFERILSRVAARRRAGFPPLTGADDGQVYGRFHSQAVSVTFPNGRRIPVLSIDVAFRPLREACTGIGEAFTQFGRTLTLRVEAASEALWRAMFNRPSATSGPVPFKRSKRRYGR